ncbi:hypothetical protein [Chitinophaga polysaccharea]|uniref:hypothetical protein n=1 Tax=Chitinophaga polysaccharea TaxID=1293035 RepID=UPI001C8E6AE7|nr:hypothetical protein [Chitinophaga polysaccharea]
MGAIQEIRPENNYLLAKGRNEGENMRQFVSNEDFTGDIIIFDPFNNALLRGRRFKDGLLTGELKYRPQALIVDDPTGPVDPKKKPGDPDGDDDGPAFEIDLPAVEITAPRPGTPKTPGTNIPFPSEPVLPKPGGPATPNNPIPIGGGGGGSIPASFTRKIDDSKLPPCMQKILAALKTLSKGSVANIVTKFAGNTPGYNWTVQDGRLSSNTNGETNSLYDSKTGTVTTTIDSKKFTSATDLSIARTILHESVHAYLVSFFGYEALNANATYPTMLQDWMKSKKPNLNTVQHNEMVRSFIIDIANALEEYGRNKGYNLSRQFYDDMAWGGLTGTSAFKALSTSEQDRINNILVTEQSGLDTNGDQTKQSGKPGGC